MKSSDVFKGAFLKAADLQGVRVRVTIDSVTMEDIGEEKERRAVAHFRGKDRGLVLNKTNWAILEEVCGSPDSDDWAGHTVTLYTAKVDYQGKRVDAIRVDDQPAQRAPVAPSQPAQRQALEPAYEEAPPARRGAISDDDIPF